MATHRHIDKICIVAALLAVLLTLVFMNGEASGIRKTDTVMGYETRLFDTERVHTVDIIMDDWDSFIQTCENEEYAACTVVIDGESYSNIGIRAKGNTSLSNVAQLESDRYSFKLEFDQYDSGMSYYGLDKLSLNNLIQDNTMMKDYLVYQMMGQMGVASPLCSYAYMTVNGEEWGLYLAVEAIEDSFLKRNYGSDYGELYKPDSMSFGAGRGNGRDFNMDDLDFGDSEAQDRVFNPEENAISGGRGQQGRGGMGSADVKLQYIDDNPDSYSNIFSNAKTDVSEGDKARLIEALRKLSAGEALEETVDIESVIRYFVVHNYVCNGDSYTGAMIHNYYLYEKDGQLAMLPWDYNLAFGTFQNSTAFSAINESIDSPVTGGSLSDRPMVAWIFNSEEYTQLYHEVFAEFLESVDAAALIQNTKTLIAPYVERDPGKFCTYEDFELGAAALLRFTELRSESVSRQLSGDSTPVDTSDLNLSDMGSMGMGGAMPGGDPFNDGSVASGQQGPQRPGEDGEAIMPPTDNGGMNGQTIPQMPTDGNGMQPGEIPFGEGQTMPQRPGGAGGMMPGGNPFGGTAPDGNFGGGRGQMMPGGNPFRAPGQNFGAMENSGLAAPAPQSPDAAETGGSTISRWGILLASAALLLLGCLFVWRYRRRKN